MSKENINDGLVNELKIDKDCFVSTQWIDQYITVILKVCTHFNIDVLSVKMCKSRRKGLHFYIRIQRAIDSNLANLIQWLLGDDSRRVDFNRARIQSGLREWNKLFEVSKRRRKIIYKRSSTTSKKKRK